MSQDGEVSPIDALLITNAINRADSGASLSSEAFAAYDVDADGQLADSDVALIVGYIEATNETSADTLSALATPTPSPTPTPTPSPTPTTPSPTPTTPSPTPTTPTPTPPTASACITIGGPASVNEGQIFTISGWVDLGFVWEIDLT